MAAHRPQLLIKGQNGNQIYALFDSGASVSCIKEDCLQKLQNERIANNNAYSFRTANGSSLITSGKYSITFSINNNEFTHPVFCFPNLASDVILGTDFHSKHDICIHGSEVNFHKDVHSIGHGGTIRARRAQTIPAYSVKILEVTSKNGNQSMMTTEGTRNGVRIINSICSYDEKGHGHISVINTNPSIIKFDRNEEIGEAFLYKDPEQRNIDMINGMTNSKTKQNTSANISLNELQISAPPQWEDQYRPHQYSASRKRTANGDP
eukprot:TRINITY_DN955_c0_g1_i10.p1 TRINITY_DN955_c0_g1~~TRINITY_DN955_c0_g1_i10.p1  ORF type:complete len:265 (-),score=0.55 TRINITY_DN955_c0_g1_i10:1607-2401(-)